MFEADWNIPEIVGPTPLVEVAPPPPEPVLVTSVQAHVPDQVSTSRPSDDPPVKVTPLLSPQNYFDGMLALIEGAEDSVALQQQYILEGGQSTKALLEALQAKGCPGHGHSGDRQPRILEGRRHGQLGAERRIDGSVRTERPPPRNESLLISPNATTRA